MARNTGRGFPQRKLRGDLWQATTSSGRFDEWKARGGDLSPSHGVVLQWLIGRAARRAAR